jgi:hypothetical protein
VARFILPFSVALVAATAKTAVRIPAPADRRMYVRDVRFNDRSNTASDLPIEGSVCIGSNSAGTATDATPAKLDGDSPLAWPSGAQCKVNYTAEPTGSTTVFPLQGVTGGPGGEKWPPGDPSELLVDAGGAASLVLAAPQARSAVSGWVVVELID